MSFNGWLKNLLLVWVTRIMDVRYRLTKLDDKIVFCNLDVSDLNILAKVKSQSGKFMNGKTRAGRLANDEYVVIAFSNSKEHLKSSRVFKTELTCILNSTNIIANIIEESEKENNKSTSRLIHNLTSLNAHNIQEFYSLVPQENVSRKMGKQISYVKSIVEEEPEEAAIAMLKMAKNNAAMKVEFSVFKKLFDLDPDLRATNHNIHKVLMNVFYLFFPDFTDKSVKVRVGDSDNVYMAYFDYESIHVALYHMIENAAKYIKPNTSFVVGIEKNIGKTEIIFDMVSTQITQEEINIIFEEGISGELARQTGKSGDGIGLSRAKKILELNGGSLSVKPYYYTAEVTMGVTFQRNVFTMTLPRRK